MFRNKFYLSQKSLNGVFLFVNACLVVIVMYLF